MRQKVLLTDDEPGQRAFYESLGYSEVSDFGAGRLRALVASTPRVATRHQHPGP